MGKDLVDIGKHAIDKAHGFLNDILKPPLKEVGLLAQDQVRYWRYKNQIKLLNRAEDISRSNKIDPRKVPVKTIAPLLDYGSLEEDEDMQEKWAALLAKAADPNYSIDFVTIFIEILRQLSPLEVRILDFMYDTYIDTPEEKRNETIINHGAIRDIIGISPEEYVLLIQNLFRVNLVRTHSMGITIGLTTPEDDMNEITRLSIFGVNFVKYCKVESKI